MDLWRDVADFALDAEARRLADEQIAWIQAEPSNPQPYYHLALLYRTQGKQDASLGLLLEAVRLHAGFAAAHTALAEVYAARNDLSAAWRHATRAAECGDPGAGEMLQRYSTSPDAES